MKPKVYVVDDEPKVRGSLADLLSAMGFNVETFESTEDFLDAFHRNSAIQECVIADLRMPGMSGLDLKRELTERGVKIPVILLTGYRDDETDERAQSLGIFQILEKPHPPAELVDVTRRALDACESNA